MSDLDKFKALFDEIGIGYVERNYYPKEGCKGTELSVNNSYIDCGYGKDLDIVFKDDKFDKFSPWGE